MQHKSGKVQKKFNFVEKGDKHSLIHFVVTARLLLTPYNHLAEYWIPSNNFLTFNYSRPWVDIHRLSGNNYL